MNYFAHGRHYTDEPYFLAGTAVPDWLGVVDRRVRVRSKAAAEWIDDADPAVAAVARGIVQHLHDDDWFHNTRAFGELSWQLTAKLRDALPGDDGLRPHLLGHILVELLLDAALIEEDPTGLEAYYEAFDSVDASVVEQTVNRIATRPTDRLAELIEHFVRARILSDYTEDGKLMRRLNQIMHRIKLPALPPAVGQLLPEIRLMVFQRKEELLEPASVYVDNRKS